MIQRCVFFCPCTHAQMYWNMTISTNSRVTWKAVKISGQHGPRDTPKWFFFLHGLLALLHGPYDFFPRKSTLGGCLCVALPKMSVSTWEFSQISPNTPLSGRFSCQSPFIIWQSHWTMWTSASGCLSVYFCLCLPFPSLNVLSNSMHWVFGLCCDEGRRMFLISVRGNSRF